MKQFRNNQTKVAFEIFHLIYFAFYFSKEIAKE